MLLKKLSKKWAPVLPNKDKTPRAKAMSVAIEIPAPDCVAVQKIEQHKSPAGIIMPPNAPTIGNRTVFKI